MWVAFVHFFFFFFFTKKIGILIILYSSIYSSVNLMICQAIDALDNWAKLWPHYNHSADAFNSCL